MTIYRIELDEGLWLCSETLTIGWIEGHKGNIDRLTRAINLAEKLGYRHSFTHKITPLGRAMMQLLQ